MDDPNPDTPPDEPHESDESLPGHRRTGLPKAVNRLMSQASEQIHDGHDAFTVAASLSFESLEPFADKRADWHRKYDLGAHVRAMVYRELWDYGWTALHNDLANNDRAQTLGYDPDMFPDSSDAPHRTTLSRAWTDYFGDDLQWVVTKVCERIREYAREIGNLVGSQTITTEEKTDASPRTKARVKRRKAHEMAEQFRDLFYDELDLNMPEDAYYDEEDLLDLFLHMAFSGDFANNGAETWREEVDDKRTAPSGDTLRQYIRQFDEHHESEVTEMFDALSEKLWQMADRRGYLDGMVDVAIDGHAWLFYGDEDTPRISKVDPDQGTDKAWSFLTLSVIGDEGEKFTVGVRQVASKQEKREALKELVAMANERLFVGFAMLDRGFYEVFYAQALNEMKVNYLIRAKAGSKSKKMWGDADEDGINVERAVMSRSRAPYLSVEVTRFVAPAREEMDYEYVAFITNVEVTRRQAKRLGKRYPLRWGIETSYRVVNDFLPRTASKDFALRQFYYRMAVLLYNTWVIVNAVVVETTGHPPEASPPVTAKYLLLVLRNKHDQQGFT